MTTWTPGDIFEIKWHAKKMSTWETWGEKMSSLFDMFLCLQDNCEVVSFNPVVFIGDEIIAKQSLDKTRPMMFSKHFGTSRKWGLDPFVSNSVLLWSCYKFVRIGDVEDIDTDIKCNWRIQPRFIGCCTVGLGRVLSKSCTKHLSCYRINDGYLFNWHVWS